MAQTAKRVKQNLAPGGVHAAEDGGGSSFVWGSKGRRVAPVGMIIVKLVGSLVRNPMYNNVSNRHIPNLSVNLDLPKEGFSDEPTPRDHL
jgi:hypothetical protein